MHDGHRGPDGGSDKNARAADVAGSQESLLFQALMDGIPDPIYFKDRSSRFILVNKAAVLRKGAADVAEIIGKTDFDFFDGKSAQAAFDDEQEIIRTGVAIAGKEEKVVRADGSTVWMSTTKGPLRDRTGAIIGTFGISRDITDRKKAEEDLQASTTKLHQAQRMEAFGQLAGGIAHDFNNLLAGIAGSAELIARRYGAGEPRLKQYASLIIDASRRGSDLTAGLVAFARKGNYAMVPLDVHAIIAETVKLLEHSLDKRILVRQQCAASPGVVTGDRTQISNALLNLAVNARDAMPHGGVLTLETASVNIDERFSTDHRCSLPPGRYLRLAVSDTGTGMDAATLARAFEPFFTTKPAGKGTGLGLASVYGTVHSHHGHVEIDSTPGAGTTVTIYLPEVEDAAPMPCAPAPAVAAGTGTILVADDEDLVREVIEAMLSDMGYRVISCCDGDEAVDCYRSRGKEIDLVIVDMVMPVMGGYDCVNELKKINPAVKVVIATGYSLVDDTQKLVTRGVAGFLQKPFEESELADVVKGAIAG